MKFIKLLFFFDFFFLVIYVLGTANQFVSVYHPDYYLQLWVYKYFSVEGENVCWSCGPTWLHPGNN